MTSFTQTFSGSALSPSDVAYASYTFSQNLVLFWPQFSAGETNVAARFMNLTATANGLNVYMPDATLVSVGYDVLIVNIGSDTFNLVTLNGNAIVTIASGQAFYINLTNNTTPDGLWQSIQFGVGTGAVVAAALAGPGLLATGGLLEQNILGTTLAGNTTIAPNARAVLQIWTGGSGTVTLPLASSVGNGFFFPFANDGSGSATIVTSGSDTIDGMSSSVFAQSQSAFIVSTGAAWYTVGKGLQNNFSVTVLNLNVAGSSNVTETSTQAQSIIQQFTGILTASINVIVPPTPQIYFVYNNTTGPFTLTVITPAGSGIQVSQGTNTILYCDGTNVVSAFSSSFGSSITLPVGSAGAPALNFQGSTSTGFYSPTINQAAITAGGHEVMGFLSASGAINFWQASASSTGAPVSLAALGTDANIGINIVPKASGSVNISNFTSGSATITGGTINNTAIGGSTPAAITGTSITATGTVQGATLVGTAAITTAGTISAVGIINGSQITSTIATGTTPLIVTSTTPVANLNIGGNAATVSTINGLLTSGTNTTLSGSGTSLSPYSVNVSSAFVTIHRQVFTSNGTYTPTTGMLYCDIEVWGGGGGGGGAGASGFAAAGGGGAGGYAKKIVSAATIGASQSVTIGAGGNAGAATGNTPGGTGGTTSVASIISASGGVGGSSQEGGANNAVPGGIGGAGSGGDVNGTGAPGGEGFDVNVGSNIIVGGFGASTSLGGGAINPSGTSSTPGNAGIANTGGGGSGAISTGTGQIGGVGGTGLVSITEYCSQ